MKDKEFVEDLKQKYIKLANENIKLRKRIEELEKEKSNDKDLSNVSEEKIYNALEKMLREHKCSKKYQEYLDDDWSYDPDRDELDWSYRPKRGTTGPYYPWPYIPGPGDWPPGPQVGDVPPGTIPPGYPYWSIFPPYWPITYYKNTLKTNTTGDPAPEYPYTVSKTGEKIER